MAIFRIRTFKYKYVMNPQLSKDRQG